MRITKILTLLFMLSAGTTVMAQTTVKGKVVNPKGKGLSEVNISSNGYAAKTNGSGHFELYIGHPGEFVLVVSAVGYESRNIQVQPGGLETRIAELVLNDKHNSIDSVDVVGYHTVNDKKLAVGKGGILVRDLPQSVQIINAQVIRDQQVNRLSDVLKNANGVALGANRGGVNENFYARGYSLGSNNIFKNGARTNNGGSIEASTLESVEILKGSAALLYGGVSGGAVVNLVTKKPKFEHGGEVSMRVGSFNQYKPIVDVYGPISDRLAFRIVGTGEYAESYRDNVESKRFYVNPSLLYKISEKSTLNAMFDYLKSDFTPDFGIGSVDGKIDQRVGRSTYLNTEWAYNKTNSSNGQLAFSHDFSSNWKLDLNASYQQYNRNYFGAERIQAKADGTIPRALNRTESEELTFNQQANLTGTVYTGTIKHQVLVGADFDQSNTKNYAFNIYAGADPSKPSTAYDEINVFEKDSYKSRTDIPETNLKTRTATDIFRYGVFAQDLVSLTDKFKVLVGIRYTEQKNKQSEGYDYAKDSSYVVENKTKDGQLLGDKKESAWSPKFALIYQPIKSTTFFVSYANNFTSNSGYDSEFRPMGPSIIDHYEAGVKNELFAGRLTANLSWYRIINDRFAQAIMDESGNVPDANMKEFTGKTASDGLDLDITGTIIDGLEVMGGYAYNFMRYLETNDNGSVEGVRLVGTTAHTGNASLFYTIQNGGAKGLKLGFSTYYTGKRNAGWNNTKINESKGEDRVIPIDPFTTFDFSAGYTYRNWSILGKISNISNEFNYYVHENYSVNPIPPRSFTTTLSYKF
ncbi:TonB-dependent siderophore receptor [Sphingobacterium hotanense]|nr:TonB-dependent siderophore receptor [Sphingobacterium hotanense]